MFSENTNQELTVQVEDIQWDQGDIGIWHKQQSSNSDSPSSRVTRNENCQSLPKLEHDRKELNDDEILSEWDSQYDFCVKDSPSNSLRVTRLLGLSLLDDCCLCQMPMSPWSHCISSTWTVSSWLVFSVNKIKKEGNVRKFEDIKEVINQKS
jgi:hypothetical protein